MCSLGQEFPSLHSIRHKAIGSGPASDDLELSLGCPLCFPINGTRTAKSNEYSLSTLEKTSSLYLCSSKFRCCYKVVLGAISDSGLFT